MYSTPMHLYGVIGCLVEVYSIFWIYVILTKSNKEIHVYKWAVFKLAASDTFLSIWIIHVVRPDILFPFPAACCRGWLSSTDGTCMIGILIVLISFTMCLASVNDCSFLRLFLLNDDHSKIDFFFSMKGGLTLLLIHVVLALAIGGATGLAIAGGKEIRFYLGSTNSLKLLKSYENVTDYPVVGIIPTNIFYYVTLLLIFFGFLSFTVVNACISFKCWRKLKKANHGMSQKTRSMQCNFTYMLIVQTSYPALVMFLPCILFCAVLILSNEVPDISELLIITTLLILLYPAISASCCFYFIGPYRKYCLRITRLDRLMRRMNRVNSKTPLTQVSSLS